MVLLISLALVSCGEEKGTCTIEIYVGNEARVSGYTYHFKPGQTVLDALKVIAKEKLNEDLALLQTDRDTTLTFASLANCATTLSEDGKSLSYWGYSITNATGNTLAVPAAQQLIDGTTVTFTYHTIQLPKSENAVKVSVSLRMAESVDGATNNTNYKNLSAEGVNLTLALALESVVQDSAIEANHKTVLSSIAAAIEKGDASYTSESAIWSWTVSVTDKDGHAKELTLSSEEALKSGDIIDFVFSSQANIENNEEQS